MGRINCVKGNFDKMVNDLKKQQANAPKVLKKAVTKAGDVLVEEITKNIVAEGVRDTGALMQSVKKGNAKVSGEGYAIEAWPQGMRQDYSHKRGERNETIGFVNEYGKGSQAPRHYMEKAANASEEKVEQIVYSELERALNG